jgi:hypothetical protein
MSHASLAEGLVDSSDIRKHSHAKSPTTTVPKKSLEGLGITDYSEYLTSIKKSDSNKLK